MPDDHSTNAPAPPDGNGRRQRRPHVSYAQPGGRGRERLGYDAVATDHRRASPSSSLKSEDTVLGATDRRKAINRVRELYRSYSVPRWMLNKHLDFVAAVSFQSRNSSRLKPRTPAAATELEKLDARIEELVAWWAKPWNFDIRGRHGLYRALRIAEACRVADGDCFFQKLGTGHTAAIEGDRVRKPGTGRIPPKWSKATWTHGIQLSKKGRPQRYCVCTRGSFDNSFAFDAVIPARYMCHHAWWDFRFDQVRGISPFLASVPELVDAKEARTYALAKMKVSQLFGLATFRDAPDNLGTTEGSGEADDEEPFEVDFGKGPFHLDLRPDDKALFLEANSPGQPFQDFYKVVIAGGLKTMDLPYSFWDEAHTNFFGSRAALNLYLKSAGRKRADVAETADDLVRWQLAIRYLAGDLVLPRALTIGELQTEWVPSGIPWWNPIQEVKADILAYDNHMTTLTDILRVQGKDFREVVDRKAEEQAYIAEKLGSQAAAVAEPPEPNDGDK